MADWHGILAEISREQNTNYELGNTVIDRTRRKYLAALAALTGRNTIGYYSGFLTKPRVEGIDINDDDINSFMACIHGMDRTKGLDLILHTPGGGIAATESVVNYLRQMFGNNVRAIIPQIAMSAGTMVALSCSEVVMGKQSSLGPIDPQIGGIPADVVVTEFQRAFEEIKADPMKAHVWAPILSRYAPSFLTQCEYAVDWSKRFVKDSLTANMFSGLADKDAKATAVVDALSSAAVNKAHNKHIHFGKLQELGINVSALEDDQPFQDAVMTVHHCFAHTMNSTGAIKIVENDAGKAAVRMMQPQFAAPAIQLQAQQV